MSKQTPLEYQLLKLVPTKYESAVERRLKISSAIEEFYQLQEGYTQADLTLLEKDLAQSFVAAVIYEFVTDNDIYRTMQLEPMRTSITESGKAVDISEVRRILFREDHNFSGLGIIVWKISRTNNLVPFLNYAIQLIFDQKYPELIELKDFAQISPQLPKSVSKPPRSNLKKKILIRVSKGIDQLNDSFEESTLKKHNPFVSYRLFLYIEQPLPEIWLKVWETLITSTMSENMALRQIMRESAGYLKLGSNELETFLNAIFLMKTRTREVNPHVLMGKLAKRNNRFVDLLVKELHNASPAKSMDVAHGLLIAAQENPYATRNYIDVVSNKNSYPYAQPEYFIVGQLLDDASKEALDIMLSEAVKMDLKSKQSFQLSRQRAAKEILNNLAGVKPEAYSYLQKAFQTIDDPNKLVMIADLIRTNNYLFEQIDTTTVIDSLSNIASRPVSILRDITEIDPISRNLRALAIKTAVKFILNSPEHMQRELLYNFLRKLITSDDDLVERIEEAEQSLRSYLTSELTSIYFAKYVFGEDDWVEAEEWVSTNQKSDDEGISGFIIYLLQNVLYGQLTCLDTMVNSKRLSYSSSSFQLDLFVERTITTVRDANHEFFGNLFSPLSSFPEDFKRSRRILNDTLDLLEASNGYQTPANSELLSEQKITITTAEYCFEFLKVGVLDGPEEPIQVNEEDKWITRFAVWDLIDSPPLPLDKEVIEFLLEHLYPKPEGKSWLERLRTRDFPPDEVVVSRINSFICKSVIRSPLMTDIHLTRILEAAASRKVKGGIRSYDVILPLLELKQYDHKILTLKHLDQLLLDKSHEVVGASLFVIGALVDDIGDNLPADLKNQLITTIQKNCARARLRNHKMFGGFRGLPISTARRMSVSVLSKLKTSS